MILDSIFDKNIWNEAIVYQTAVYQMNISNLIDRECYPSKVGKRPGRSAYFYILKHRREHFDPECKKTHDGRIYFHRISSLELKENRTK